MINKFIEKQLKKAKYKILEDKTYFGEIPSLQGIWANARNLESCRKELKEVLEDWLVLKIRDKEKISGFNLKFDRRELINSN